MEDKRELVGVSPGMQAQVRDYLQDLRERNIQIYDKAVIPREEIDPRVLQLEEELHKKNAERAAKYGLEYTTPQVLYLDRVATYKLADEMKPDIEGTEITKTLREALSSAGFFMRLPNAIAVFSKSFPDTEIDAYWTACSLRHEMAHAGSVQKIQVLTPEPNSVLVGPYRTGPLVYSTKKGTVGEAVAEGHNSNEDALMNGELEDKFNTWKANRYLSPDEELCKRFSKGYQRYQNFTRALAEQGMVPENRVLVAYRIIRDLDNGGSEGLYYLAIDYAEYRELMAAIYDRAPEVFGLTEDFIYGDRVVAFARRLDQTFGRGFFGKLMRVTKPEEAKDLLREIVS